MIRGGSNVIIIEIKCTINVMPLSRPETTPHPPVHGKTVFRETGPQKGWVPLSCSSLCSDTWRWSQIPQVRTQPHETAHHTHNLGHQSQVQLLTASYQLATSRRFPQPYPWVQLICEWGLQNSEEQFTYSITSLHKGYNSGKARGQRCTGQRVDEGAPSEHGSSGHHPPNASGSSSNSIVRGCLWKPRYMGIPVCVLSRFSRV